MSERLDKDAILNSLTEEDIIKIVTELGSLPPKRGSKGELIFQTICHNTPTPSNSWKLYYYKPDENHKIGLFHCYSGCQDSFSIIELVIRSKRTQNQTYTFYKALKFIASITGKTSMTIDSVENDKSDLIDDFNWINRLKRAMNGQHNDIELQEINENILEMFCYDPISEWLDEGISREALSTFEIGYWGLENCITIPHRDINGKLVGIRGRFLDPKDCEQFGKYRPLNISGRFLAHNLSQNLYGLNVVKNTIQKTKKVLLVESEKACMQSYSMYGDHSFTVAVCGSSISKQQMKILISLGVNTVEICFDREYKDAHSFEAQSYLAKLLKKIDQLNMLMYFRVFLLLDDTDEIPEKSNPFDIGKECVERLLDNKILVTDEMIKSILGVTDEKSK